MRARAFGLMGVLSGIAMALGPSLGGVIAAGIGWRWIFLVNLVPCLLIALLVPRLVPEARSRDRQPLDGAGVALLTLALGLVIGALLHAREAPMECAFSLAAALVLITLFTRQQRGRERPMFDPAVFARRAMLAVAILLLAVSVGYWSLLVYLPAFLAAALHQTADEAGLMLLLATLPMLVLPPFGGRLALRLGWRGLFALAMSALTLGGIALLAAALADGTRLALPLVIGGMVAIGIGVALAHPQLSGAVVALAPSEAAGMASALTVVARQAGFAVGVALLGTLAPSEGSGSGYALVFGFATVASGIGLAACTLLTGMRNGPAGTRPR